MSNRIKDLLKTSFSAVVSTRLRRSQLALCAMAVGVGCPRLLKADNWLNTAGGSYSVGTNWSTSSPPDSSMGLPVANFATGSITPYTVTNARADIINVQGDQVTLDYGGSSLINSLNTTDVNVTSVGGQTSNLTFANGTLNTTGPWSVGSTSGTSTLNITSSFTGIIAQGSLSVGGGTGSVTNYNQSGGEMRGLYGMDIGFGSAGQTNVTINGGKTWAAYTPIVLGYGGNTTVAQLTSADAYSQDSDFDIGANLSNSTVTALNSTLSAGGFLQIGVATSLSASPLFPPVSSTTGGGTGKLTLTNSPAMINGGLVVGDAGGTGTLIGTGATTAIGGSGGGLETYVGYGGTGSVNLSNGATLQSHITDIGSNGGTGTVTLSGTGTAWTTSVFDGSIGAYNGSAGTGLVELDHGATWTLTKGEGQFGFTGGNVDLAAAGTLQVLSGARVNAISLNQVPGSTLEFGLDGATASQKW